MARGDNPFASVSNVVQIPVPIEAPFKPTIPSVLVELPEPEFIVKHLIPKSELTLFAGEPNIGKGWLALMLQVACALGRPWLRRETRKCKSLAIYSEDPEYQLRKRFDILCKHYGNTPEDADEFVSWVDRSTDPIIFKGAGRFSNQWKSLPLWQNIRHYVADHGIELLILDNAMTVAEIYDNPAHVKSFCRWLIAQAEEMNIAIILLLHPPANDFNGTKWFNGSANWARVPRNALAVQRLPKNAGGGPWWHDDGKRVLIAPKNNFLPYDHPIKAKGIMLEWKDGVLQRT